MDGMTVETVRMSGAARVPLALCPVPMVAACHPPCCVMGILTVWMLQMKSPVWVRSQGPASNPLGTPSQGPDPGRPPYIYRLLCQVSTSEGGACQ